MELDLEKLLADNPAILLFLVIGSGYLLGKINIKGIELGSAGGVLFAALLFGHHGYELPHIIETIGFVFFIYSVGFQSGPRFFSTFRQDGARYISVALVVVASAACLVILLSSHFELGTGYAAGILGGALTSTPTLAAAQDAVNSGVVSLDAGETLKQVNANITVGYAISYAFGLLGLILFMRILPGIAKVDMPSEATALARKLKFSSDDDSEEPGMENRGLPMVRIYKVTNEAIIGRSLGDLKFIQSTQCLIMKIKRGGQLITPEVDTVLNAGDVVAVMGFIDSLEKALELVGGPLVHGEDLGEFPLETRHVVVTNSQIAGLTLRETGMVQKYHCLVTQLTRSGQELPLSADLRVERGDLLVLSGIKGHLDGVIKLLGHAERPIHETDLLTFAFGIVGGIILGTITIKVGDIPIGIGMAGGLLFMGLVIGYLRSQNPTFGRVPAAARFILMELGILFFLAGVGLRAGQALLGGVKAVGPQVFLSGAIVTIIPVVVGFLFGKYVLKMNPVILMGALAGSLTSTPALGIVNKNARSTIPALGYAGTYAVANIFLTVTGQVLMYW